MPVPVRPRPQPVEPQPDRTNTYPHPDRRDQERELLPGLSEKQKLEQLRKKTQNQPRWDANKGKKALSDAFDGMVKNNADYMNALQTAASENKPILMMIGKSSDPASRYLIENTMKDVKSQGGKDALAVFVDMDQLDRNSALGKYAFENMPSKGQEPPFTMVFTLSKSREGQIKADPPSFYRMGDAGSPALNEAISRAKAQMSGRFSNLPKPENQLKLDTEIKPETNTNQQSDKNNLDLRVQQAISMALVDAAAQKDPQTAFTRFKQAIDLADQSKNPMLQAATRVELGLACFNWGFPDKGFEWILDAGSKNPGLYDSQINQPFRSHLSQRGMPENTLDLLFSKGKQDAGWYKKDSSAVKTLVASLQKAPPPEPKPAPEQERPQVPPKPQIKTERPSPWS